MVQKSEKTNTNTTLLIRERGGKNNHRKMAFGKMLGCLCSFISWFFLKSAACSWPACKPFTIQWVASSSRISSGLKIICTWQRSNHTRKKGSEKSAFCLLLSKDTQVSCIVPLVFHLSCCSVAQSRSRHWALGSWSEPVHQLMSAKLSTQTFFCLQQKGH